MSARISYDKGRREFRTAKGKPIAQSKIDAARDVIVKDTERKLIAITEQFKAGKISLEEWQLGFRNIIKPAHTLAAGIAMGGKEAMTVADWGRVGKLLRVQYERLFRMALQAEQGQQINMGRVKQYARAVRSTFINAARLRMPEGTLAKWIRHAKESCEGCISQAAKGATAIENLPPIGSQQCRHNCLCEIVAVSAA
jgi:hypothetical protein